MSLIIGGPNKTIRQVKSLSFKKGREKSGLFIVEGERAVRDAIKNQAKIKYIIASEDCDCIPKTGILTYKLSKREFSSISETVTPQGIIAVCEEMNYSLEDIKIENNSCVVLCENVQDPGNVGTIIRTADSAGCSGVILTKGSADIYNPKTVRSTMSSIFSIPIVTNADVKTAVKFLKKNGVKIVTGSLDGGRNIYEKPLLGSTAVVLGNEGNGASDEIKSLSDELVYIPMLGNAESLNVTIAGGIMIYEHLRVNKV